MAVEIKVPAIGESITEAEIQTWHVAEGDAVMQDQTIAELETDKVNVELPAPATGRISKLLKQVGDTVAVGETIGHIEAGEVSPNEVKQSADAAPAAESKPADSKPTESKPAESPKTDDAPKGEPRIMPAAQRAMATLGVSAEQVTPTGPGGRMLKEDVEAAAKQAPASPTPAPVTRSASAPAAPAASAGEEDVVRMSPLRRKIASALVEAQNQAALLTTFNECDVSAIKALRASYQDKFVKKHGVKLGFMSFFVKAAVDALRAVPTINATIRDDSIVYRNHYDIGIAVNTERGLVVPVVRNADRLSFAEIEKTIGDLAERGRLGKLDISELQGGTFTITNGGVFGSLLSTPIVNPPQSGVLGMHAIQDRPVARDGQVVIRPMMYLALTYDHRIVDGRGAITFLNRIKETIEEPSRILLEV